MTYIDSQNKRQSFRHTADGECRFTEINGVSIDTMKRQDATRNTVVIVSLLIVAVIVGYLRYYLMRDLPEPNSRSKFRASTDDRCCGPRMHTPSSKPPHPRRSLKGNSLDRCFEIVIFILLLVCCSHVTKLTILLTCSA